MLTWAGGPLAARPAGSTEPRPVLALVPELGFPGLLGSCSGLGPRVWARACGLVL